MLSTCVKRKTNSIARIKIAAASALFFGTALTHADVFISEIHYDNASTDEGEAIEISADLNTDLSGWSVVLYNGNNGESYNTLALNGFVEADPSCGDAGGVQVLNLPTNGLQNGSPDGLALVNNNGSVIEFLSYEGEVVATNGPASGMTSSDIGVAESSSTPVGESLQLVDGSWEAPSLSTFGICTTEVSGGTGPTPTPSPTLTPPPTGDVSISEFHYDNEGSDVGEALEISGPIGTDLSNWQIVFYNGNGGASYGSLNLSGSLAEVEGCDAGYAVFEYNGIQNGSPDGFALVDPNGNVVEFLSYEGELTATDGPANSSTSTNVGVAETSSTPIGQSLQKVDGNWNAPANNTFGGCGANVGTPSVVKIHEVQGSGNAVALAEVVSVEAVVVADYQNAYQLSGFFIQEEDADADANPLTSEGIFVFCDSCPADVAQGDLVKVTGLAQEFFDMSQIRATLAEDIEIISSGNDLPSPATLDLPVSVSGTTIEAANTEIDAFYEAVEGMLANFPEELTIAEYFELGRYGQVVLAADGRPRQFTDQNQPSAEGYTAHQINMAARTIILDDDNSSQNAALFNNTPVFHPQPGLSADNVFRGGDSITSLTGVLHYSFSQWRVRPVENESYAFSSQNPRSETPEAVGGSLKVASFNVLNYFTTLDEPDVLCSPNENLGCRGAHSANELERQTAKIVAAICAIDADIVGLMELENPRPSVTQTPIAALVEAINAECSEYAALETGGLGGDAITVGFIYKPATVALTGTTAILDSIDFTDPNNTGVDKNRPAIAQSFVEIAKGATLTVAVNHLKSKGSGCGEGDDDTTSGQGNCNLTRTLAAEHQAQWLAGNPTGVDSEYVLVIGDLNAYRNEAPITAFKNAGYTDLVDTYSGADAYGFLFDGQLGYLDHGLANDALLPYITSVTDWHINADEINLLDYNDTIQDAAEQSFEAKPNATELYAVNAFRSSDHDPLIIGIDLPPPVAFGLADLIQSFKNAVEAGEITGKHKHPWLSRFYTQLFVRYLEGAEWAINADKLSKACRKLNKADNFSDMENRPRDLIRGEGVAALNAMIQDVKTGLGCSKN